MRTIAGAPRLLSLLLPCWLATACGQAPEPAADDEDTATLAARVEALGRTVDAAEALRAVKRLQWAYGHYSEFGLWHDFADLFADTGVGHYTQGDLDREGIRALFLEQVGQGQLGLATGRIYPHISFAPVISLDADGEHARGRFRILAMLGGYGGNALWFHGVYENAYVRERGVWKINEVSNAAQVSGTFATGLAAANAGAPALAFHYGPGEAGRVAAASAGGVEPGGAVPVESPIAQASTDSRTLAATLASLVQRLDRLDDEAAIAHLQHRQSYLLARHDWDALVELFAAQASFEPGLQGVYVGKESIRQALDQFGATPLPQGEIDDRILFQTYVSVAPDGRSAAARVDELGLQGTPGVSAQWTQGIYENTYVNENGEWRIQSLHYYPRLITDYDLGWGADAQAAPGPDAGFPSDAPPSESVGVYPEFYIPAFHFAHPVSGRPPQYPEGDPVATRAGAFAAMFASASAAAPDSAAQDSSIDVLQPALSVAEARAQRALAYDAVEDLIAAYAYYLDECLLEDASALFTAAGTITAAECPGDRPADEMTLHHVTQPVIDIADDGASAGFTAHLWEIHAAAAGEDEYRGGLIEGEARRESGQWKLSRLERRYTWSAAVPGAP